MSIQFFLACIVESRDGGAILCLAQTLYTEVDKNKEGLKKKPRQYMIIFIISFLLLIAFPYKRMQRGTTMGMRHNIMRTRTSDKRQVQARNAELAKRVEGERYQYNKYVHILCFGGRSTGGLSVSVSVKRVSQERKNRGGGEGI